MSRTVRKLASVAVCLALPAGCTALAGIQDGVLAQTDASTDSASGGDSSPANDGAQPDSGSADGSADDSSDGGASACTPGSTRCTSGGVAQQCTAGGQWSSGTACPFVCQSGACIGQCVPGSMQCNGNTPQTCDSNGAWQSGPICAHVCSAGRCAGACTPGAMQCSGNTPQTCTTAGTWQNGTACPYVCSGAGVCSGMCVPGILQACGSADTCNAGGMQLCDATGALGACSIAAEPCVSLPSGWQAYSMSSGGSCPGGFANAQSYIGSVSGLPDSCTCSCSGTQACSAAAQLAQYAVPGCGGAGTVLTNLTVTPSCVAGTVANIVQSDYYGIENVSAAPAPACNAMSSVTNTPPVTQISASLCTPALACTTGVCLTSAQQGSLCVAQSGDTACPTGYPNKTLVASDYVDTRACSSCSCSSTLTCTLQSVLLDNDTTCGAGPYETTVSGPTFCAQAASSYPLNAIEGTFTTAGSDVCGKVTSGSQPTGSVSLDAKTTLTVCCP